MLRGHLFKQYLFFFFWWDFLVWVTLTPIAEVELSQYSQFFWHCSFFFSFRAFLEGLLERLGPDKNFRPRVLGFFTKGLFMALLWPLATIELAIWLPQGQFSSIFLVLEWGQRAALALTLIVFLTIWSKFFSSRSWCSNLAWMKGFRFFQKYPSIVGLIEALIGLYCNKIDYKCFR